MTNKVKLPFKAPPFTFAYHEYAFSMGIIQGNAKGNIDLWLSSINISLRFADSWGNKMHYSYEDVWNEKSGIILKQRWDISQELFSKIGIDRIDIFKKLLELDNYIHGVYNEEFDPIKASYHKRYHAHDFLIIGYDDSISSFYCAGFNTSGQFAEYTIPYDEMKLALETFSSPRFIYDVWKYNPNANFDLNLSKAIEDTEKYITSTKNDNLNLGDLHYGMNAMERIIWYFRAREEEIRSIDMRFTRCLMEHKFFLQLRTKTLKNLGYPISDELIAYANSIYKKAELVHMLGLKYNMTGNKETANKMCALVEEILETEKDPVKRRTPPNESGVSVLQIS